MLRMNNVGLELLVLDSNTWNYLTVCKQVSSGFKINVTYKLFYYKLCMCNLALNNSQGLICYKTQPNQVLFTKLPSKLNIQKKVNLQ